MRQRDCAVGERGVAREREHLRPGARLLNARLRQASGHLAKPAQVGRGGAVVTLGPQDSEHQGPVDLAGPGDALEVLRETGLEPERRRRRIGQRPVQPHDPGSCTLELGSRGRRGGLAHGEVVLARPRVHRADELTLRSSRRDGRLRHAGDGARARRCLLDDGLRGDSRSRCGHL